MKYKDLIDEYILEKYVLPGDSISNDFINDVTIPDLTLYDDKKIKLAKFILQKYSYEQAYKILFSDLYWKEKILNNEDEIQQLFYYLKNN